MSTFIYLNGKNGIIMACRYFMYYGITGDSYGKFRRNVAAVTGKI